MVNWCHGQFSITYPNSSSDLTICQAASELSVRIDVTNTGTSPTVTIDLPDGVFYIANSVSKSSGSIATITESDVSNLNVPVFALSSTNVGEFIEFSVERSADDCAARTFVLGGGVMKDVIIGENSAGTVTESDPNTNSYNLLFPAFALVAPPAITNAEIGDTYDRTFTITNGGTGCTDIVRFALVHSPLCSAPGTADPITSNSMSVVGGTVTTVGTVGDTTYYEITGAALGGDNLFCNGETVTITENITVGQCNPLTEYFAGWGCGASATGMDFWCQTEIASSQVTMKTGAPIPAATALNVVRTSWCRIGTYDYRIDNDGATSGGKQAAMYNVVALLGHRQGNPGSAYPQASYLGQGRGRAIIDSVYMNGQKVVMDIPADLEADPFAVNMQQFTTDPDGPGGLDDLDDDGFYDDLPPGESFVLNVYDHWVCFDDCNVGYAFSTKVVIEYQDVCENACPTMPPINTGVLARAYYMYELNRGVSILLPPEVGCGEVFTMESTIGRTGSRPDYRPTDSLYIDFILPVGLSAVGGTGNPTLNGVAVNPGNIRIMGDTIRISKKGPSSITIYTLDLQPTLCDPNASPTSCGNNTVGINVFYVGDDSCDSACQEKWVCTTRQVNVKCPGPCADGVNNYPPQTERLSLGYTDETLTTKVDPANINNIALRTVLPRDTLRLTGNGEQFSATGDKSNLHYHYQLQKTTGGNNLLEFIGGTFTMTLADGTVIVCPVPAPTDASTSTTQIWDWDLSTCNGGVFPIGAVYKIELDFAVSEDGGLLGFTRLQPNSTTSYFYNLDPNNVDRLYCDEWKPPILFLGLKRQFNNGANRTFTGCNSEIFDPVYRVFYDDPGDVFPTEYRPAAWIDEIRIDLPAGYRLDPTGTTTFTTRFWSTPTQGTNRPLVNIDADVVDNGSSLIITNPGTWLTSDVGSGGDWRVGEFRIPIIPTCEAATGNYDMTGDFKDFYYVNPNFLQRTDVGTTSNRIFSFNDATKPAIELNNLTGTVQGVSPQHFWDVRISNPSTQTAPYIWLALPDSPDNAGVDVTSVEYPIGTPVAGIPYADGTWYQISAAGLPSAQNADVRVYFNYYDCAPNSLDAYGGWDCGGYPDAPGDYACQADSTVLTVLPQDSEVQLVLDVEPTTAVPACDPFNYELTINSARAANIEDVAFQINMPVGMALNGDVEVEYPRGSGNWEIATNIGTTSNPYFDLSTHSNYPSNGLPGTVNFPGTTERQMGIRFAVETDCDFSPGNVLDFQVFANRPCGNPAIGNGTTVTSSDVNIVGVSTPYFVSSTPSISDPILNCDIETLLSVSHTIAGAGTTGANDEINITLPAGVNYTSTFNCTVNCPTFVSNTLNGDNTRTLLFNKPAGLTAGDVIDYEIGVESDGFGNCGDMLNIRVQTSADVPGPDCDGTPCSNVQVVTSTENVSATVEKPSFSISNFEANSPQVPTGGPISYNVSLDVSNDAVAADAAAGVTLEFFCLDGNGDPMGAPIHTVLLPAITAGGSTNVMTSFSSTCDPALGFGVMIQDTTDGASPAPATANMEQCLCSESALIPATVTGCTEVMDITASAIQPSCVNDMPQSDGYLQLSSVTGGDRYHFSMGSTFDDNGGANTYANATDLTGATYPVQFNNGLSNADAGDYTIRVYNGQDGCFTDVEVTLNASDCSTVCNCTEYVYLNEPGVNVTRKFAVNADATFTQITQTNGDPWASATTANPHGAAPDLNGFIYIGNSQGSSRGVDKYDCDGNELVDDYIPGLGTPDGTNGSSGDQFNIYTIGNTLYLNGGFNNGYPNNTYVFAYDLCTAEMIGEYTLCGGSGIGWDFVVDEASNQIIMYNGAGVGFGDLDANLNGPCIPTTTDGFGSQGITIDGQGNIYSRSFNTMGKYDYDLNQSWSVDLTIDGGSNGRGVVYSKMNNWLIASGNDTDCLSIYDTDGNYLGGYPNPPNAAANKALSIVTECCPSPLRQTIDQTICADSINQKLFLNEIFPCNGVVCGAEWTPDAGNTGITYDPCDQSITITGAEACATFTKEGTNAQCGTYNLTYNVDVLINTAPVISGVSPTCAMDNDPMALSIETPAAGDGLTYTWQSSTTDCTTGWMDIAGAPTDGTPYDPPALSQETYYRVITQSNGTCSSGMCVDTSNCVTITPEVCCALTDAGETLETCNNNGTGSDPSDDYITFSLNPVGANLGASYSVTADNGATVTLTDGSPATGISYNAAAAFRLQDGSADGATNFTITVTDVGGAPCQITTMVMQSACSNDAFDLALRKTLSSGQSMEVSIGDTISYQITVYNQGSIEATDTEITDYVPSGLIYETAINTSALTGNAANWAADTTYTISSLVAGDSTTISLKLIVSSGAVGGTSITNWAEISADSGDDIDSTPDDDNFNQSQESNDLDDDDVIDEDGMMGGDEDDHDPALIMIETFDLALTKTLAAGEVGPWVPGDTVTFTIEVFNQGTVDATGIEVTEIPPSGMINVDGDWSGNVYTVGNLGAGMSTTVDVDLLISPTFQDSFLVNNAEITAGSNALGLIDEDGDISTIDGVMAGDASELDTDNDIDDEAAGTPGTADNGMDVDDYDPERIVVTQEFDLALTKTLAAGEVGPWVPGDTVTFTIEVFNQGTVDATGIEVTEIPPSGMINVDGDWSGNVYTVGNLGAGMSTTVDVDLLISPTFQDSFLVNNAEITAGSNALGLIDEDGDISTIDGVMAGDASELATDNDIDDEAAGTPGTADNGMDVDDYDPERIVVTQEFDLALRKSLAIGEMGPWVPGDTVTFTIEVFNQGTVDATGIEVTEIPPSGMINVDGDWSSNVYTVGNLGAGMSTTVDVDLLISPTFQDSFLVNNAEITAGSNALGLIDEDGDISTIDGVMAGDASELDTDNDIDDEAAGTPGTADNGMDVDDYDPERIVVTQEFDLALTKTLAAGEVGPWVPGDTVTFTIEVFNQGTVDATGIEVTETPPTGMTNVDPDWSGSNVYTVGNLGAGMSTTVDVDLLISPTFQDSFLVNNAEITAGSNALGLIDEDGDISTIDGVMAGDASELDTDNDIDDEAAGTPGTADNGMDVDDYDPERIVVTQEFDLAINKRLAMGEVGPFYAGDTVTFTIAVYNQGTLDADTLTITEYVPTGMTNIDMDWVSNIYGITDLSAGDSVSVDIDLRINDDFQGDTLTNNAEITYAENALGIADEDDPISNVTGSSDDTSELDTDNDYDDEAAGTPGSGDNPMDIDDYDLEQIGVVQEFDLAINKRFADGESGPYRVGDMITFTIEVYNQGTLDAQNVVIRDYVPSGMSNVDGLWPSDQRTIASLAAGDSVEIDITLMIDLDYAGGELINNAEIIAADNLLDYTDEDSDIDDIDGSIGDDSELDTDNDYDDEAAGTPGTADNPMDVDDYDPELIELVDVALIKTVIDESPYIYGDTVSFIITTINQSSIPVTDLVISDYVPEGFSFDGDINDGWTAAPSMFWAETYEMTIIEELAPGGSIMDTIHLILQATSGGIDAYTNVAEVTSFRDTSGVDRTADDLDSPGDNDPSNDAGGAVETDSDGVVDGDGSGDPGDEDAVTDEDNADPARVEIIDVALYKVISDPSGPYAVGDTITYDINLINQGNVITENFRVYDFAPIGLTYINSFFINPGWSSMSVAEGTVSTFNYIPQILPGDTATLQIKHIVNGTGVDAADYTNIAEISSFDDEDGDPVTEDIDSRPNFNPIDDPGGVAESDTDNTTLNENGDEDDHDPALVEIIDMALIKTVVTEGPYGVGDTVQFAIEVINQGNIVMDSIVVNDYVPSGYTFDGSGVNSEWSMVNDSLYQATITGGIAAKASETIYISLVVNPVTHAEDEYLNIAELSSFQDEDGDDRTDDDTDSDADDMPDNDGGGEEGSDADDEVDGDGSGDPGDEDPTTDEDDADPARIEIVDLALTKTIASPMAPYSVGDTLTFDITIYNQGTVDAYDVVVYDHAPVGLTFESSLNPGWDSGVSSDSMTIGGPIVAGGDTTIQIVLIANDMGIDADDYTNYAEIGSVEDEDGNDISDDDQDSDPDNDPTDDGGGEPDSDSDDEVDGDGSGDPGDEDPMTDEDDHDPALVEIIDMALIKTVVTEGPYGVGDTVQFAIEVINQGNIVMDSIVVNDYVPSGYTFDASGVNADWSMISDSLYQTSITDPIAAKASDTVYISLVINPVSHAEDEYLNISELSSFQDEDGDDRTDDDTDSDADDIPDNDGGGEEGSDADDEVEGDGTGDGGPEDPSTDEDDSDPAQIEIVDFALRKTINSPEGPYAIGQLITFDIWVYNQGTVAGHDVVVYDHVPMGFEFDADINAMWFEGAGSAPDSTIIDGPIAPGDSALVQVILEVTGAGTTIEDYTNRAEVGSVEDEEGTDISDEDQDSTPDDEVGNDSGGDPETPTDDEIDGDGSGDVDDNDPMTDEDDEDPAFVRIVDLALTKTLAYPDSTYGIGDTVDFVITIYNQGNIPADSVLVHDYTPEGLAFDMSINDGWSVTTNPLYSGTTVSKTLTEIVYPDQPIMDTLRLTVLPLDEVTGSSYTNVAEIGMFTDTTGVDISDEDVDSPSDMDPDNDGGGDPDGETDDEVDGDGSGDPGEDDPDGDEDNSDPSGVDVVDFALKKTTARRGPFFPGDQILYDITIYNQGNVPSSEMVVYDHVPAGLDYIDDPILNAGWTTVNDSLYSFTYKEVIGIGDSAVIHIYLTPNGTDLSPAGLTNVAEIGGVKDEEGIDIGDQDVDSTPDDLEDNDEGGLPGGDTDNTIDNEQGDEDDADPAQVCGVMLICNPDIDTMMVCYVEPYATPELAGYSQGTGDECDGINVEFSHRDSLVPAIVCDGGDYYSEREVIRNYRFFSESGGFDTSCVQRITYSFNECNQALTAGTIAIRDGQSTTAVYNIRADCDYIPEISDHISATTANDCQQNLEYMWLVSTVERTNGQPYIPNDFNMGPAGSGAIWQIIPGAVDPSYTPDSIIQNTYYVRCTRTISCCDFMETNLVGYRIDNTIMECPVNPNEQIPSILDCDNAITLNATDNNMLSGEQMEYKTNRTIDASNRIGGNAELIYNAKEGTTLHQGFEVEQNAQLEVKTDGCDNNE